MLKLLPVVAILLVIGGGIIYFRFRSTPVVISPQSQSDTDQTQPLQEVPKSLPGASLEDQLKTLEDLVNNLIKEVNNLKSPKSATDLDLRLKTVETGVTELKARVSSLEKATPAAPPVSSSKVPAYIPLGSGGQLNDTNWTSLNAFQISLDPAQYGGYTSMQLEVNMRLNQPGGQVSARLYNSSSNTVTSSEISSTSTTSSVITSAGFTLPSGAKNYVLQAKSKDGSLTFVDNARIKVNF